MRAADVDVDARDLLLDDIGACAASSTGACDVFFESIFRSLEYQGGAEYRSTDRPGGQYRISTAAGEQRTRLRETVARVGGASDPS